MTSWLDTSHLKRVRDVLLPDVLENVGELVGQHPLQVDDLVLGLGLWQEMPITGGVNNVVAVEVHRARRRSGTTIS
jgi:hypothetical protein